jgi:hypothetical protein
MKTTANLNQLNHERHAAARPLLQLCLLSACLFLAWTGVQPAVNTYPVQRPAAGSVVGQPAPYDLAHDANYRAEMLLYTAQNRMHDFPF